MCRKMSSWGKHFFFHEGIFSQIYLILSKKNVLFRSFCLHNL